MSKEAKQPGAIEKTSGFLKRLNIAALVVEGTAMLVLPGSAPALGRLATLNVFGAVGFGWIESSERKHRTQTA